MNLSLNYIWNHICPCNFHAVWMYFGTCWYPKVNFASASLPRAAEIQLPDQWHGQMSIGNSSQVMEIVGSSRLRGAATLKIVIAKLAKKIVQCHVFWLTCWWYIYICNGMIIHLQLDISNNSFCRWSIPFLRGKRVPSFWVGVIAMR